MNSTRAWTTVGAEIAAVVNEVDPVVMAASADFLGERPGRWFFTGQGRSGLVAEMAAMRLMHLGRPTHAIGEPTAPSIGSDDHLVAFSGSGDTAVTLHLARLALDQGADLMAVTSRPGGQLAQLATHTLLVPAPVSRQFGGSLFEQSSLILFDSLVLQLSGQDPDAYAKMHRRHTNLQ